MTDDLGLALGTDFFSVRADFTDEQWETFIATRRFVDDEVLPVAADHWERAELPMHLVRRLADIGVVGEGIRGHGAAAMSPLACGLVTMELHRGDGSLGTFLGVHAGLAMQAIDMCGSDEQRARWLPPMASLELLGAFALTEPDHGSDSIALETRARRDGDAWVIDGRKRWIGNGTLADLVVCWARDEADDEVKGFVIETPTDGYAATDITGKGAMRAIQQADIDLTGVRVPDANRLTQANSFADTAAVLATTRGSCAWAALGHATAAYDTALTYAKQRHQFGQPLAGFQIVQQRLVHMLGELTAMQLYCVQIARLAEAGTLSPTVAGLAKMHNTRKARGICADARDLLGGNGILLGNHVMTHMADIEAVHTFEGTEAMQTLIVGRDITGVSAFG